MSNGEKTRIPGGVYFLLGGCMFLCVANMILIGVLLMNGERNERRFRFLSDEAMKIMAEDNRWTEAEKADIRAQLGID